MSVPHVQHRAEALSAWLCREVLPHERDARRWLHRTRLLVESDDIIQEAYARIAALESVSHIQNGRAYFLTTVRNIALQHLKRGKIISFGAFSDVPDSLLEDDRPGPEAITWAQKEVDRLMRALPERCRTIFRLCRMEGYTQKEVAMQLGLSENVVEKQIAFAVETLTLRFSRDVDAV